MKPLTYSLIAAAIASQALHGETIRYPFDDGTLQGWTQIDLPGATAARYAITATDATISNRIPADSGTRKVMVYDGTDRRAPVHATGILRSPAFTLPAYSAISAKLLGSMGKQGAGPASAEALSPNTQQDFGNGYAGIALRRTSDKAYILYASRSSNAQSAGNWQSVGWTASQIAAATASDAPGETYALDFIDNVHADWGWIAMDTVEINRGGALGWSSAAGQALKLTGVAGKTLETSWSAGTLPTDALTVEAWVNLASGSDMTLLSAGSQSQGGGFALRHSSANGPYIQLISAGGTTEVKKTNRAVGLGTGAWKHVAVTWSKAEKRVRVFVDGHLYHDKIVPEFSLAFPGTPSLHIGSRLGLDGWLNGSIDEVRVWNRALTQAEVQEHKHVFRTGTEGGLIGLYALNGFTANKITDQSAELRHLSATNVLEADFTASTARIPDIMPAYRDFVARLEWQTREDVRPGIVRKAHQFTDLFGKSQSIHVLEVNPAVAGVHFEMAALPDGAAYRKPSSLAQERLSVAAINGSYWHTSGIIADTTPPRDKATQNGIATFTRVNGQTITDTYEYHAMPNKYFGAPAGSVETVDVDYADDGAVTFDMDGGGFDVIPRPAPHDTSGEFVSGWKDFAGAANAMASGPLLLQGGNIVFHYRNSYEQWNSSELPWSWQLGNYPFTAAGRKADGTVVFVVGDGRSSTSLGLSVEEVAHLMLALDCTDAIKLDGGGSSAMYVEGKGVVNSPSDGSERSVPSALLVVPNDVPAPGAPPAEMNIEGPAISGDIYYPIQPQDTGSLFFSAKIARAGTTWSALGLRTGSSDDTAGGGVDIGRSTAATGFALFDYLDHKGGSSATARKPYTGGTFDLVDGNYQIIGEVDYSARVIRAWITDGTTGTLKFGEPMIVEPFTQGFTVTDALYLRLGSGNRADWTDIKLRRAADSGARQLAFAGLTAPGAFKEMYAETFTTLGATGTTPPTGWSVWNGTGANNTWTTSINGADLVSMTRSTAALKVGTPPSGNANEGFNAALAETPDNRMLGTGPTTTAGMAFQLELTNSGATPLEALSVSYDTQRFTVASSANELPGYWLFYSLDNGATWSNVSALNPLISGTSGVIVPNTTGVTTVPATAFNLSSAWQPGGKLLLRWVDDNARATSPDQLHGLDNVIVAAANSAGGPVIARGSTWKYNDEGTDPGAAWKDPSFDDTAWKSGPAQLGYGEGDEATVMGYGSNASNKYPAYFLRHSFNVADPTTVKNLALRLLRDDGAVVYLNGQEILRDNMPAGEITHLTYASATVDGGNESTFFDFNLPPAALVAGRNVLAVSMHQDRASSSDISFDLELTLVDKPHPDAPVFSSETLTLDGGIISSGYSGSLASYVTDPNGDALVFSKVNGPAWLVIAPDGTISGTPGPGDTGVNEFVISVTDNRHGTVTAVVRITVSEAPEIARAPLPGGADALRFGIIPDTQGSTNGVPTAEATAVSAQMVAQAPDFAIHVGDVTDGNLSGEAKMTELNYYNQLLTTPLANAGITTYPIRGNHDTNIHTLGNNGQPVWKNAFPHLFQAGGRALVDPASVPGGNASTPNANNYSYVLDAGNNTFLVALDMWQGGSNANYPAWVGAQVAAIRAAHPDAHIFGYSHSGLFSSSSHPAMTEYIGSPDDFIAIGKQYGIDGWFSGHNHIFDRSMAIDSANGGNPAFFNITVGSASSKFYDLSRSPVSGQNINRVIDSTKTTGSPIAYQIVSVNGAFVTVSTWMSPKNSSGGFTDWKVWDELTYSRNGRQFSVPSGGSYNAQSITHTASTAAGFHGTTVRVSDGTNSDTTTHTYSGGSFTQYRNIAVGWTKDSAWHASGKRLVSDVASLHGMNATVGKNRTDAYTLSLSYDAAGIPVDHVQDLSLVAFLDKNTADANPGEWLNATEGTLSASPATQPLMRAPLSTDAVGTWGIDAATGTVWARLDYQGDFAISSNVTDMDNDGLADDWEMLHFGSLAYGPLDDPDGDGLINAQEQIAGTSPVLKDTDGDLISDAVEIGNGLNPLAVDTGLVADILANLKASPQRQSALGLYTRDAFAAIRGEPMLEKTPEGKLRMSLQPMVSPDLKEWSELGDPAVLEVPIEGRAMFFQWFTE